MPGQRLSSPLPDNCTTAGATGTCSTDGRALIGSTSDDPFTTRTRLVVEEPPDGYRYVGTQIVSQHPNTVADFNHMHTRGLNEKGFAYTWSGARPDPDIEPDSKRAVGVPFYRFGDLLLSQAASVQDAIGLLESYPRAIHGNFLFADSGGEVALAEVSTRSMNIETRTTDGWIGRSNHWISPEMSRIAHTPADGDSTVVRYDPHHDADGGGRRIHRPRLPGVQLPRPLDAGGNGLEHLRARPHQAARLGDPRG